MFAKTSKPEAVLLVFGALVFLFIVTGFLSSAYRAERQSRASAHFQAGDRLAREGHPAKAVEEYRAALSYSHNESQYQLALAISLMDLGRLDEAVSHLRELRETDPNSAVPNLLLARIAARQGRVEEAIEDYHRAIYGLWPSDPQKNRVEARFELVELLNRNRRSNQVLPELLELAADAPPDQPEIQDRIGNLLLKAGSAAHAEEVFREVLSVHPTDRGAALGLAQAYFVDGNYAQAETAYRRALRLDPKNEFARLRLQEMNELLAMDPTLVRLGGNQRYQRAKALMERTLASLDICSMGRAVPPGVQAAAEEARKMLKAPRSRRRVEDTPQILTLTEQLWKARGSICGPPPPSEEALSLVLAKVAK